MPKLKTAMALGLVSHNSGCGNAIKRPPRPKTRAARWPRKSILIVLMINLHDSAHDRARYVGVSMHFFQARRPPAHRRVVRASMTRDGSDMLVPSLRVRRCAWP